MKAATINELKKELTALPPKQLVELCLRLAKYKKESKELLTYLIFESDNESDYIRAIKSDMDVLFEELNMDNYYFAKKGLQKIVRSISKYIKYSGIKNTEIEVLMYFCKKMKATGIKIGYSPVIENLYNRQLTKIKKSISSLHEDLQFDYQQEIEQLEEY
ncbi:hypothetical protein [uncultured Cytophaga sp.]|uniref:hypothetical protein n=1 Tax=uncultured Cytophaga sp. TaxID=160238 RepID=UPI00262F1320|nr:hypothetical protein [uncultured Cytophaga sp.]